MPSRHLRSVLPILVLVSLLAFPARGEESLTMLLSELTNRHELPIATTMIRDNGLLQQFYAARAYEAAWNDEAARSSLRAAIGASEDDGLSPGHYHAVTLAADDTLTPAEADLLYTDALIRLASDHFHGRLDPVHHLPEIDLQHPELGGDALLWLERAIASRSPGAAIALLAPTAPIYLRLKEALATHRRIVHQGGWDTIPEGPTLHPGDRSERVAALRTRLRASGDLDTTPAGDETLFDEALAQAVRRFQARHQLATDAVAGPRTLAAANVPLAQRIDQIRVNLERARWLLHDLPPTYVLVDIAGFEVRYVREGIELLRSRATVGRPYRKTPVFRSAITSLEFNPAWTVPPTILANDVLPAIRRDIGYLSRRQMRVLTLQGQEVDPRTIDWNHYRGRNFPWIIRQDPGPNNSLGQLKITFPNAYMVYLHDTPERQLFTRPERAFSSGCIRVEQARRLAELLLESEGRGEAAVRAFFDDPRTRRIDLAKPVPILLYYWTVAVDPDNSVIFRRDIYDRDPSLLAALDRPWRD